MEDVTSFLIIGMYVLLVFCLLFFFTLGRRIQQMGERLAEFESAHQREMENVREQVVKIKENVDKTWGTPK
ncbi:hypothetical protein KKA03_03115 [archaeon]|nr:hypothetical protein [archaeon]